MDGDEDKHIGRASSSVSEVRSSVRSMASALLSGDMRDRLLGVSDELDETS